MMQCFHEVTKTYDQKQTSHRGAGGEVITSLLIYSLGIY